MKQVKSALLRLETELAELRMSRRHMSGEPDELRDRLALLRDTAANGARGCADAADARKWIAMKIDASRRLTAHNRSRKRKEVLNRRLGLHDALRHLYWAASPWAWLVNHHHRLALLDAKQLGGLYAIFEGRSGFGPADEWFMAWCDARIGGMPVLDADRFLKLGIHENSDADIASVVTFSRPGDEIVYVMKFTGLRLW